MDIYAAIESLSIKRKIFQSEADFQFALAWEIQELNPTCHVRLEYVPAAINPTMHIDIFVHQNTELIPIELKYLKKRIKYQENEELFDLRENGAQDISRYDILKDIQRIERLKSELDGVRRGYVIVLTNDPAFWKAGSSRKTIDHAFRLSEGMAITGNLSWTELAGAGTTKGRKKAIQISGNYLTQWKDYSKLIEVPAGTFRYLLISV